MKRAGFCCIDNCNDFIVPLGNMAFMAEIDTALYRKCKELEQYLQSDFDIFPVKMRLALEEFVIFEESKKNYLGKDKNQVRFEITKKASLNHNTYVETMTDLCMTSPNSNVIQKIICNNVTDSSLLEEGKNHKDNLFDYIRKLFKFCSVNAHSGIKARENRANADNCREYFKKFHLLLTAYYGAGGKFDSSLVPFNDYYPVQKDICKKHGIILPEGKQLYIRIIQDRVDYYIFTSENVDVKDTQKRDIDTINKLWVENIDTPQNIINNASFASNKNGVDYKYWIHHLPAFPHSLTESFIEGLSMDNRLQIVKGLLKGVASMHNADPPFYHRTLSMDSFLVFKIRGSYKPLLINFDCVKDNNDDIAYTVVQAVADLANKKPEQNFAPEVLNSIISDVENEIDWEKADIYALGQIIKKIIYIEHDPAQESDLELFSICDSMCITSWQNRPQLNDIISQLYTE